MKTLLSLMIVCVFASAQVSADEFYIEQGRSLGDGTFEEIKVSTSQYQSDKPSYTVNEINARAIVFKCSLNSKSFAAFNFEDLQEIRSNSIELKLFKSLDGKDLGYEVLDVVTKKPMDFYNLQLNQINHQNYPTPHAPNPRLETKHVHRQDKWGHPLTGLKISNESEVIAEMRCASSVVKVGTKSSNTKTDGTSYGKTVTQNSGASVTTDVGAQVCLSAEMHGRLTISNYHFGKQSAQVTCQFQSEQATTFTEFLKLQNSLGDQK